MTDSARSGPCAKPCASLPELALRTARLHSRAFRQVWPASGLLRVDCDGQGSDPPEAVAALVGAPTLAFADLLF